MNLTRKIYRNFSCYPDERNLKKILKEVREEYCLLTYYKITAREILKDLLQSKVRSAIVKCVNNLMRGGGGHCTEILLLISEE